MWYPNLFKRFIPFAVALILGLFVASFFVSIKPTLNFIFPFDRHERGRGFRHWDDVRDLQLKYDALKEENEQLRRTYPDCKSGEYKNLDLYRWEVPAPPPMPKMDKRLKEKLERLENNNK